MTTIRPSTLGRIIAALAAAFVALAIVFPTTTAQAAPESSAAGSCGQKIAIVIDTSGSMTGNQEYVIDATDHLLDALNGTASHVGFYSTDGESEEGVISPKDRLFGADNKPFSTRTKAGANAAKKAVANWIPEHPSGDSLGETAFKIIGDKEYDQIFFITDGWLWYEDHQHAERLKKAGTVISMIIVDNEIQNLGKYELALPTSEKHIFTAESYEQLTAPLKNVVTADCKATININNHLAKGVEGDVGNWKFSVGGTPVVTDETGYVSLQSGVVDPKGEKVTVTQNAPDYTIIDVKCKITDGDAVPTTFTASSFDVKVAKDNILVCDVTNTKSSAAPDPKPDPKPTTPKLDPKPTTPKPDPKPDPKPITPKPDPKPDPKPAPKPTIKPQLAKTGAQTDALGTIAMLLIATGAGITISMRTRRQS
ncbi:MAG: hypothetical protein Q4P66_03345 [Actinomycetaceae bacterium]|nr:hypothetical protein [Actinomycetaceae bacterium]